MAVGKVGLICIRSICAVSILVSGASVLVARPVYADMAPPAPASLGGINPEGDSQVTQVQMLSERVVLDVQASTEGPAVVQVTARFQMRNRGTTAETMQARYPLIPRLSCDVGYSYYIDVATFSVLVDSTPVITTIPATSTATPDCSVVEWAAFPVKFPPGQDVWVDVNYMLSPGQNMAWQSFTYILESGAGWRGSIGAAEIILRLPYGISDENVRLNGPVRWRRNEARWYWRNLEPTEKDNLYITMAAPSLWKDVLDERASTAKNPGSSDDWARLARSYSNLATWHYWEIVNWGLAHKSIAAYEQAIAYKPRATDLRIEMAQLLLVMANKGNPGGWTINYPSARLVQNAIDGVLAYDPTNANAKDLLESLHSFAREP